MKNEYEIRGDVTAIFVDSPMYGRKEFLISTNKLKRAKEFPNTWCLIIKKHYTPYAYGFIRSGGKRIHFYLHRWLTNASKDLVVDHIDHNGMNNIDSNLRVLTQSENCQNRQGPQKNSKSGIRGVCWSKWNEKWSVRIYFNKKDKFIGYFGSIEDAAQASISARAYYMPYSREDTI